MRLPHRTPEGHFAGFRSSDGCQAFPSKEDPCIHQWHFCESARPVSTVTITVVTNGSDNFPRRIPRCQEKTNTAIVGFRFPGNSPLKVMWNRPQRIERVVREQSSVYFIAPIAAQRIATVKRSNPGVAATRRVGQTRECASKEDCHYPV